MVSDFFIGLVSGSVASLIVGFVFYKLGGIDLKKVHQLRHLDFISSQLHLLDPRDFDGNAYGSLGVRRTAHLFKCEAAVMREYGFEEGAEVVFEMSEKILAFCKDQKHGESLDFEFAKQEKMKWKEELIAFRKKTFAKKWFG